MASNFFPMLSSSPPPIDDNECFDDEDDEFGAFKTAEGALEGSSLSFDLPDHSAVSVPRVPELRATCSPDPERNVCTENGINGEFSVFSDCALIHKKGRQCERSEFPAEHCSCDSCELTETLDHKMAVTDHHPDAGERVSGEKIRLHRHSIGTKKLGSLGTYSDEAHRINNQNSFCEISLRSSDSQVGTKDLQDTSQDHSLGSSAFIDCMNDVSPQLLLSQEESSSISSMGDGLSQNLCDDTEEDMGTISGAVYHSLPQQEISRTSNHLDIVGPKNYSGVEEETLESVSDSEDHKTNPSEDIGSYSNGLPINESFGEVCTRDPSTIGDREKLSEADVCPSIPMQDDEDPKLHDIIDKNSVQSRDFVSDETFLKHHTFETPDEFDDFQQAEFVYYEEPHSGDHSMYHKKNSFDGAASLECSSVKYSVKTSCSVPNQVGENYLSECFAAKSLAGTSTSNFRTEDTSSTSGFADFESATFSDQCQIPCESVDVSAEDSFADFESAASKAHSVLEPHSARSTKDVDKGIGKISAVINAIFPVSEDATSPGTTDEKFEIWEHNAKSNRLWDKLHETEQTPGLRFQWGVSHSFQLLLRSVNVDYHSILRTSSVPFFASGLSLLEPTKGPVQPTMKLGNEENAQVQKDVVIPPVQFDWSSSGLVNPLDPTQATSTLMDLSFLSSTESNSPHLHMSSDLELESEFLQPCYPASPAEPTAKPPILQQLLSSTVISSLPDASQSYRPSTMSQEATHVLDQLPDLSIMRAKVLMFPLSSNV